MQMENLAEPLITIDPERCNKDGICVRICQKVFAQRETGSVPDVVHPEYCHDCGHCVAICPTGAIRHRDITPDRVHAVAKDLLPSHETVLEMIRARRSTRTFLDKPVEREIIDRIIDGARFAPSAKNSQSTRFIVIEEKAALKRIASITAEWLGRAAGKLRTPLFGRLYVLRGMVKKEELGRLTGQFGLIAQNMAKGRDLVLFDAPALVLFHADRKIRFAEANANLALANATFVAGALGLGSFYTGYVVLAANRGKTIAELVGLPKSHQIYGGLALGYPEIRFSRWIDRNPAEVRWI